MATARPNSRPIIIRRVEADHDHGHHGGAWKVAYADFMTAMMAFFLLMWIVSSATKDQLNGISDYFTPAHVSMTAKGGMGALGGTTIGPKGVLSQSNGTAARRGMTRDVPVSAVADNQPVPQMTEAETRAASASPARAPTVTPGADKMAGAAGPSATKATGADSPVRTVIKEVDPHAADDAHFHAVQQEITQAMKSSPDLAPLLDNVMFRKTPDGLEIQIVDQKGRAMFASGSAAVDGPTLKLMERLGKAISGLPNKLRISGHTDAVPYAAGSGSDNWELSSERANATRRVFLSAGVEPSRVSRISGLADTEPLVADNPRDPRNRRITVLLRYQPGSSLPADLVPGTQASATQNTGAAPAGSPRPAAAATAGAHPSPAARPATPPGRTADLGLAAPPAPQQSALQRTYSMVSLTDLSHAAD
ncbi:flagellar motor protein MotB [Acidimangrovimonas sediminis]|uniref:flagellar motor protein MotB n=1 Tax=Acidimangrovimonas sediminis TaxID=2056283 RepID=UPI000C8066FB|nr:flagellar motor protein MotB [Acidimangrovimonas sediminis]